MLVQSVFIGTVLRIKSFPQGFPGGAMIKNLPVSEGDLGLIPGSRRSPGEGKGNPLQYSYLGNPMGRVAWWATYSPWGHKVLDTTEQLSMHACTLC